MKLQMNYLWFDNLPPDGATCKNANLYPKFANFVLKKSEDKQEKLKGTVFSFIWHSQLQQNK